MSRPTGSKNKQQVIATPDTVQFSTQERIEFLADLIATRIAEDEANGFPLLKGLQVVRNESKSNS